MTRKRNANSPMESEKAKQSTSAAASTLGMAAMMSVVSSVFSSQGAPSVASESDDDSLSSQTSVQDNPWNAENLEKSQVKSPKKNTNQGKIEPIFDHHHDGSWRDEIEVEIQTKNKKKFTGTITPIEAKHLIYINGLKFENHSNFDGVRINFKGKLIVTFKLLEPINIDELDSVEHFEFTRTATINGRRVEEVIGCRIKGVRYRPMMVSSFDNIKQNDDTKLVKIEGCEYRVTKDEIIQWLSLYGEVTSNLEEDCFRDETETIGANRTGNYSVLMRLESPIPQLLPMCGRRIKIYHAGIQKLCTNCFGPHKKQFCQSKEKTPWINYVKDFIESNEGIPPEMFGRWVDLVTKISQETNDNIARRENLSESDRRLVTGVEVHNEVVASNQPPKSPKPKTNDHTPEQTNPERGAVSEIEIVDEPTHADFDIPTSTAAYESMVERFITVGLSKKEVDETIKTRTTAYNRACREHKKQLMEKKKQEGAKAATRFRRGSIKKQ